MFRTRNVLNTVFLLVLLFNIFSYFILPENVAIHFGRGGEPDGWSSRGIYLLIMNGVLAIIYVSFYLSPKILDVVPAKYISLPNSEYWLNDENRQEAVRRLTGMMDSFGAVTVLLMLAVSILTVMANRSDPVMLNDGITWILFILYMIYTVWWSVRLLIAFKVPENNG